MFEQLRPLTALLRWRAYEMRRYIFCENNFGCFDYLLPHKIFYFLGPLTIFFSIDYNPWSYLLPHQDASFLYTDPVNIIGFWIALDDATLENGCLWFARGSHKSGVHRKFVRNPDPTAQPLLMYTGPSPHYQKSSFTAVPVSKGSCILIHGQVVHSSESNKSEKQRNVYTFHVIEQKNTKYSSKNWLQAKDGYFMNVYRNI
ncbi:hypothetical protein RI129_009195 [Pyrocoelia pectoralis]|uniref:Phytanoyl-CoA dioxygenase domain-containing protein 1 n=1 Tax=Pyrocoelia pectoralis TaxID=417401 RepID=A0AAN7ZKU6_9COLE